MKILDFPFQDVGLVEFSQLDHCQQPKQNPKVLTLTVVKAVRVVGYATMDVAAQCRLAARQDESFTNKMVVIYGTTMGITTSLVVPDNHGYNHNMLHVVVPAMGTIPIYGNYGNTTITLFIYNNGNTSQCW